ncbi:hypothetical protein AVEN_161638-1, partial [Araneus ventricosus]
TAKGGIKYELVLSEPSVNDPPKKDSITSPPKTMSVEEIEQKLKAAEERRLVSRTCLSLGEYLAQLTVKAQ